QLDALAEHRLSLLLGRTAGPYGGAGAATGGQLPGGEPLPAVGLPTLAPGSARSPQDLSRRVADGPDAVGALPTARCSPLYSRSAVELRNRPVTAWGLDVAVTTDYDHPTATALAEHLLS
ncbi:acyl carrier protein, partial [Streptomyces sp. BE20]|uniref:acyl carrier protein n=1 Tax=Streptomyces sp. BE20 TaxID=3002525 RepID=UPI002E772DC3